MTDLAERLRERGQRATTQRLVLHRVLRELDRHVTAEEVLSAAGHRLPGLSLPTVYATLELFADLGIVRRVPAGGSAALWDPRVAPHQHFACRSCGRVLDLEVTAEARAAIAAARSAGHEPAGAEVVVTGTCAECAADAVRPAGAGRPR
jgi:Fe2+ or Zn2+ uptake regulation protein